VSVTLASYVTNIRHMQRTYVIFIIWNEHRSPYRRWQTYVICNRWSGCPLH